MTYTFQTTGDETEVFDAADDSATPVVLVRRVDGQTIDTHHRQVAAIVAAMNQVAADDAEHRARTQSLAKMARRAIRANAILSATNVSDLEDPGGVFEDVHDKANDLSIETQRKLARACGWLTFDGCMPKDISDVGAELFDELTHGNASDEQIRKAFRHVAGRDLDEVG